MKELIWTKFFFGRRFFQAFCRHCRLLCWWRQLQRRRRQRRLAFWQKHHLFAFRLYFAYEPCDRICITLLLCYCSPAWLRLFTVCLLHTTDMFCLLQSLCTLYFNLYAHSFAIYMYAKAVGIRTTTSLSLLLFFPVFCMDGSRFFYSYLTVERCWYDMNVFSPVNIFIIHILYMAKICANLYGTVASATFQRDMFRGADGVNVESARQPNNCIDQCVAVAHCLYCFHDHNFHKNCKITDQYNAIRIMACKCGDSVEYLVFV